jgi:hypothetical protein
MRGYPGENDLDVIASELSPSLAIYSTNEKLAAMVKDKSTSDLLESALMKAGESEEQRSQFMVMYKR